MAFGTLPLEWSAGKPSWGTLPELHEVVALAHAGAIDIEVERLLLEDAVDGYRRLRNGEIVGRAVVVP
jgi:propanol-preferring alcohol dehydrogenase